eukprot:4400867-Prymnesium_polylepis.1
MPRVGPTSPRARATVHLTWGHGEPSRGVSVRGPGIVVGERAFFITSVANLAMNRTADLAVPRLHSQFGAKTRQAAVCGGSSAVSPGQDRFQQPPT